MAFFMRLCLGGGPFIREVQRWHSLRDPALGVDPLLERYRDGILYETLPWEWTLY